MKTNMTELNDTQAKWANIGYFNHIKIKFMFNQLSSSLQLGYCL